MKKYIKLLNANVMLSVAFILIIGFMSIKTLPVLGVTNFIKVPLQDALEKNGEYVSSYEDTLTDKFQYKYKFLNLYAVFSNVIGKKEVNGVFKLDNGNLLQKEFTEHKNIATNKKSILEFCKKNNAFYVQSPVRTHEVNPDGSINHQNLDAKEVVDFLRNNGVNTLDLNKMVDDEGIDRDLLFFKTDHHWTIESAFWGYQRLVEKLNNDYGCSIDSYYADINNFEKKVYEDWLLGSGGKRTGNMYNGVDDFSVIYPKFTTNMAAEILLRSEKTEKRQGNFQDVALVYKAIETKSYYNGSPYSGYLGGDYPHAKITNYAAPENKRIVIVKDSFANPVCAFLSLCFKEVHVIDVRAFTEQTTSEKISEIHPDIVLVFYNGHADENLYTNLK